MDAVFAAVFDLEGTLFFSTGGDLWSGVIDWGEGAEWPALVAERRAPLATLETQNTTPLQMGVKEIAIAGDKTYARVGRMGGSGHGTVISLRKPKPATGEPGKGDERRNGEFFAGGYLQSTLRQYAGAISSVAIVAESSLAAYLCASPDGARVYFVSDEKSHDCVIHGGKLEYLRIARPAAK